MGETIEIMDHTFRICGIVEHGKGGRKLVPIDTMGDLIGSDGKASLFYIKSDDPANEDAVIAGDSLHARPGGLPRADQSTSGSRDDAGQAAGLQYGLDVVTGIAVIVGFLVIFQSMYTAVLERTREIGILKSMGASKLAIVSVVLREMSDDGRGGRAGGHCRHLRRAPAVLRYIPPRSASRLPHCGW